MDIIQRDKSYLWLKRSMNYLIATEFLLDLICDNENKHSYFGDLIDDDLLNKKLESNDAELFSPAMFNFYHALEVTYKGLIQLHGGIISKKDHGLKKLSSKIQKLNGISNEDKGLLCCYVDNINSKYPEFGRWISSNGLTIDSYYEFLKYPELKSGMTLKVFNFLGKEKEALPFYKNFREDIKNLRKFIVSHYYNLTNEER